MRLPALLISDLHLTANPDDEYRWTLFEWLIETIGHEDVKTVVILGDLTDAKDFHSATLVNRVVENLVALTRPGVQVTVLQGNHDYLKSGHTFFGFANNIPNIRFITKIGDDCVDSVTGPNCFYLPHTKTPAKDWAGLDFSHYSYVFMHQTISGAVASNGQEMDGEEMPDFTAKGGPKVYSGDIHVPQVIKGVEYVGSPYHVHFGDNFKPRAVLLDRRNRPVDLHFKSPRRLGIKVTSFAQLKSYELDDGDQVKLTVKLSPAEASGWLALRRVCEAWLKSRGAVVHDIRLELQRSERRLTPGQGGSTTRVRLSDPEAILRFVEREELGGDVLQAGLDAMR